MMNNQKTNMNAQVIQKIQNQNKKNAY
jgi:hypothetical protein